MRRDLESMHPCQSPDGWNPREKPAYVNQIRDSLKAGTFLYTLEYVPDLRSAASRGRAELRRNAELVGRDPRIAGVNVADRVKSLDSLSTVECGELAALASGKVPLLHLAGKDRNPQQARSVFDEALSKGLAGC